jgi:3-methylcrotonyl-CoA carboxylase alpha subunit
VTLTVHFRADGYLIDFGDESLSARGELNDAGDLVADIGGARLRATFSQHGREITIGSAEGSHRLLMQEADISEDTGFDAGGRITSTLPGTVTRVLVAIGDTVERGQPLIKLEAMKMEHTITAPAPGRIAAIRYQPGDQVSEDVALIEMEE